MSEVEAQGSAPEATTTAPANEGGSGQTVSAPEVKTSEGSTSHEGQAAGAGASGETPKVVYTPNLKYKVKGQEKEFDKWLAPVITDAETEKKVRELYEKAHGIDFVKDERKQLQTAFQKVSQEHAEVSKRVSRFEQYVASGDIASAQREAGISDLAILQRAKQIIQASENPELKAAEEARLANNARVQELEDQNAELQGNFTATAIKHRAMELDSALVRPDIAQIVAAFDVRAGRPGAFRDEIIKRGSYYQTVHNVDKSVDELLAEVVPVFSGLAQQAGVGAQPMVAAPAANGEPATQQTAPPVRKPVIPNVAGRNGTSPVKKAIRSIDDIRARAEELNARN